MNKTFTFSLFILCTIVLGHSRVFGQAVEKDSARAQQLNANMAAFFNKAIADGSRLYNGPAFTPYKFIVSTNANYKDSTSFENGAVNYDGIAFPNVPLIYDLNKDILISKLYNGFTQYVLLNDRVSEFTLFNHHFIHLYADSADKNITDGFYDQLYKNKIQVLAKRTKSIQVETTGQGITNVFRPKTTYYIKKGKMYYNASGQGKFLDVLADKKKELKQYLKNNKVKFSDDPEGTMTMLAAYYDQISN